MKFVKFYRNYRYLCLKYKLNWLIQEQYMIGSLIYSSYWLPAKLCGKKYCTSTDDPFRVR